MTTDQRRPARMAQSSPLVQLWNALLPLKSVASFMMTGAHPDDEASGLLARLAKGDGARVIYVCATRGQGGQNALGPESGNALAAIRSREMEEAARILDMELHWLDRGFGDPLADFGFAKTAEATLAVWGEERLLDRLVRAIRTARPDVICPTFLDVPGQHGHHRAVKRATLQAFELAADPRAFPEHMAEGLVPWSTGKLYLPAYSGAGSAYDDAEPPPPGTIAVDIGGHDETLGASYARIGEWSRACHASQEMGRASDAPPAPVALHLLTSRVPTPNAEASVFDGLPRRLGDLNDGLPALKRADAAIDQAFAAFPDFDGVAAGVHAALAAIGEAERNLNGLHAGAAGDLDHRLQLKRRQLARASRIALSLVPRLEIPELVVLGEPMEVRMTVFRGGPRIAVAAENDILRFTPEARRPFGSGFDPLEPASAVSALLRYKAGGTTVEQTVVPSTPPMLVPPLALDPQPERQVVRAGTNETATLSVSAHNHGTRRIDTTLRLIGEDEASAPLHLDPGEIAEVAFALPALPVGLHRMSVNADGVAHGRVCMHAYEHIGHTNWIEPAAVRILVADVALPERVRIGYVDGGGDRVADWLVQLGLDVTPLDADHFGSDDLRRFDTIIIGVRAFGQRPDLAAARSRLHAFVRQGGHLVTQYHRPWDGWDPEATPPARLEIGQPSVRWRVCDPGAPVGVLAPDHPLLTYPNRIGPDDWQGWRKERGLYFASAWDKAYEPLLALSDPGEAPLAGALLSARIGAGRHTHVSLSLAHQMDELVPGGFRLFANLAQGAGPR